MRVGINARMLWDPAMRGWNRYTISLLSSLAVLDVDLILYSDRPLHEENLARIGADRIQTRVSPPMRYFRWEQRWLPGECARDHVDVLHCPMNFGLPWSCPCPRVLTLHDAIDQVYYQPLLSRASRWNRSNLIGRFEHWLARTRAEQIITVSQHARGDLIKHLGIPADRITVVSEASDAQFHKPVLEDDRRRIREVHGLSRPYFFYIGGWEGRKNIPFFLEAFARASLPNIDLLLAGGRQDDHARIRGESDALGISSSVRLLNWVEDDDLPAIYAEAMAFVYPSIYEGFGLQICEAMTVGCPVLASRATSLPEVLGDGGELFGLEGTGELAALLTKVAEDETYRKTLSALALRRSKDFSWSKAAAETLAVYHRLI